MANYYFLIASFPPLTMDAKPEISFKEVKDLLALNLSARDMHKVEILLRPIDLYNIRALWLQMPLDDRGNISVNNLEEELLVQENLPLYLVEFLERYESTSQRLRYFSSLYASLYAQKDLQGFLLKYYRFERDLRLVLTAIRAKKMGRDVVQELQFEDPADPLVADILAQKEALDYSPPLEYEDLKTIFVDNYSEPRKLQRAVLQYRFDQIEEMEEMQDFSVDRVLAYIARLLIVESWAELNWQQGIVEVKNLSRGPFA